MMGSNFWSLLLKWAAVLSFVGGVVDTGHYGKHPMLGVSELAIGAAIGVAVHAIDVWRDSYEESNPRVTKPAKPSQDS